MRDAAERTRNLEIYYQNVRGIRTKTNELLLNLLSCDYDLVVLTETWLRADIHDSEFSSNYHVFRHDRDTNTSSLLRGGGVLVAVKTTFACREVTVETNELEQVIVRVQLPHYSLVLSCIYIRPNSHPDIYMLHGNCLQRTIADSAEQDIVVALGDYNLPLLSWNFDEDVGGLLPTNASSDSEFALTESMLTCGLQQINCISNANGRLLDLAFVSDPSVFELVEAPTALLRMDAHHIPFILKLDYLADHAPTVLNEPEADEPDWKHCDMDLLNTRLSELDWGCLHNSVDVDGAVQQFYEMFRAIISEIVPRKARLPPNQQGRPSWWTPQLQNLRNKLRKARKRFNRARKRFNRAGTVDNAANVQRIEGEFLSRQNECFIRHVAMLQIKLKNDPRKFWAFVNERKKSARIPAEVAYRNVKSSSLEESANLFAQFFETVHVSDNPLDGQQQQRLPLEFNVHLPLPVITADDVKKALQSVNAAKGPGPDKIPPLVLKSCADSLATPICTIFNRSLTSSVFPGEWKTAAVTPIHKSGNRHDVGNYRPISILSCLGKIFEKLVYNFIYPAVRSVVSEYQHGFMQKRSTTSNLMTYTTSIIKRLEKRLQVDAIYVDLAKAFDRVPHRLTIAKLGRIGLPLWLTGWLDSYLSRRTAYVRIGPSLSRRYSIPSGVPQGSHLGPLIFILFINDLPALLQCENLLYADDLKIYRCIQGPNDCTALQDDVDTLLRWCASNGMEISRGKCKVITFHRIRSPIITEYRIGGEPLERVQSIKDLGVILDRKLSFNEHISAVTAKSFAMLGFIRRNTACFNDVQVLKTLYCSLVRSILENAAPVWAPFHAVHQQRLERVQRSFVRFAARLLPWNDPTTMAPYEDLCALLSLPTLVRRRTFLQRLFVFDTLQNNIDCPDILENIRLHAPARRFRESYLIRIQGHRTAYGHNNPLDACCRKFNDPRVLNLFDFNVSKTKFKCLICLLD